MNAMARMTIARPTKSMSCGALIEYRLKHEVEPPGELRPAHPEHFGNALKSFIIKLSLTGIGKNSEIDCTGQGQIVDASCFVERDFPHQVKSIVIPGPHAVPGIFRRHIVLAGTRTPEESARLPSRLVHGHTVS